MVLSSALGRIDGLCRLHGSRTSGCETLVREQDCDRLKFSVSHARR